MFSDPFQDGLTPEKARKSLDVLQSAFEVMMDRIADYILEHEDDIREGGFALSEVVDRYGMQLMSFGAVFSNIKTFTDDGLDDLGPIEDDDLDLSGS
tara:strand:+ start:262 stop:552 length:291 start_codon:yes stop_codon:yes gene_type:complete